MATLSQSSRMAQLGYLAGAPSNVEVSCGGDDNVMSFYSTVASTAWRNHGLRGPSPYFDAPGDVFTGYVKNHPHVQSPRAETTEPYISTYDAVNDATQSRLRATDSPTIITAESELRGGFALAASTSPIKWRDRLGRQSPLPQRMLAKRRKADPTEWENDGQGPADYSTSFKTSYIAPDEMEDRCNAGPGAGRGQPAERKGLSSGWRENNLNRDHPWVHPGVPGPEEAQTTYRHYVRYPRSPVCKAEEAPMKQSGYTQSSKKLVFGRNVPQATEKLSTTHLAYINGRTSPMAGLVVEVRPGAEGKPLGSSGFCKNLSDPGGLFPQVATEERDRDGRASTDYLTSFQESFVHPASRIRHQTGPLAAAAGLSSAYARAVKTVKSLEATSAPTLSRLHPTVALLRAKRDPYFYDTRTFKITQQARPWMVPRRPCG